MVPAVGHGAPRSKTVHGKPVSPPRNHAEQQEVILLDDLDIPKLHGVRPLHDASMPPTTAPTEPNRARHAPLSGTHKGEPYGCVSGSCWLAYTRCQPRAGYRASALVRAPDDAPRHHGAEDELPLPRSCRKRATQKGD